MVLGRKWDKIVVLAALAVVLGFVSGALRPLFMEPQNIAALVDALHAFAANFENLSLGRRAFAESLLRYGRPLLLIWACAAFPKVVYAALLVLYLQAMTLGFSAAMMVQAFGGRGFGMALGLYAAQNLVIMPVLGHTIWFISRNPPTAANRRDVIKAAARGILCVVFVALLEVYVAPRFFEVLL